jgi:hypothetical protein
VPNVGAVANRWQVRHPTNRAGQAANHGQLTGGLTPTSASGPLTLTSAGGTATATGGWVTAIWIDTSIRQLGNLNVTEAWHPRLTGLNHPRALGQPTTHGSTDLAPIGQHHARAQGNPTLTGRALPQGLQHNRSLGAPAVNIEILTLVALDRG